MKNIDVIGMPIKYGCYVEGADMAYDVLKDLLKIKFVNAKNIKIDSNITNIIEYSDSTNIRYIKPVMELNNRLYKEVYNSHLNNSIPLVIGGDHSLAIGSISSDLDYYKGDVSIIWIDAHLDIHNDKTTPSGNIHGMPLSICIGECDNRFDIGTYKLNPSNIFYLGTRSYEKEEIEYVNRKNITHYFDHDINNGNIESIINEIRNKIKTKYVHLSIDLDVLNKDEFYAVNVSNGNYQTSGGVDLDKLIQIIRLFLKLNICTIDLVEYNPLLDINKECYNKISLILDTIGGSDDIS